MRSLANGAVAAIVVSLPFVASAAPASPVTRGSAGVLSSATDVVRAQTQSRGGVINAVRTASTVVSEGVAPISEYTLSSSDTLASLSNYYGVSVEAIAFANGITDAANLPRDRGIRIPPAEGALYAVAKGDTVAALAERFHVPAGVIMEYNRLYFEPEHFAPGQLIFIRGATLPGLVWQTIDPAPEASPSVIARSATSTAPLGSATPPATAPLSRRGAIGWPVDGIVTQAFWYGHTGTDVAAPYGTGIASSIDGVVSAAGWVAVGGLRVCVRSGTLEVCDYHTSAVYVSPGQYVARGQIIAAIGLTGVTTGPHVHWECKLGSTLVSCPSVTSY
ncbi:MAG: M23 family metallopeptidase [Chloroflexota bacterium]|nr:M23 family metallopeptidase [Chloroflexota bacterium]